MKHKRSVISIAMATLVLLSLCTVYASTSVSAANSPGVPSSQPSDGAIVGASSLASAPAVCSWGAGRLDVFVKGTDGALWHKYFDSGDWHSWEMLSAAGQLGSGPAAVSWGPNRIDVFIRGNDGALYQKWWTPSGWAPDRAGQWAPVSAAGQLSAGYEPTVCSWAAGRLDVFVRGNDGHMYQKYWQGSWSPWVDQKGGLTSSPGAVSWSRGGAQRIDVFARGGDGALYQKYWAGSWSDWIKLSGNNQLASAPTVCSWAAGRLDVFVRGNDGHMYQKYWQGSWSPWVDQGQPSSGALTLSPGAGSWGAGRIDVFARGTDGALWQKFFGNGDWSTWVNLGLIT